QGACDEGAQGALSARSATNGVLARASIAVLSRHLAAVCACRSDSGGVVRRIPQHFRNSYVSGDDLAGSNISSAFARVAFAAGFSAHDRRDRADNVYCGGVYVLGDLF